MSGSRDGRRTGHHHRARSQMLVRASLIASSYAAAICLFICVVALTGYAVGWRWAWRPIPDGRAIHPLSASCLIMIGSAAWLSRPGRRSRTSFAVAIVTAFTMTVLLMLSATGFRDAINMLSPFQDVLVAEAAAGMPIRLLPVTAATLFLLSVALILRHLGQNSGAQLMVGTASIAPIGTLLGYAYGMSGSNTAMGPVTALSSLLAAFAIAGGTAHKVPLRSVLTINLPGRIIRLQIVVLVGFCLVLSMLAVGLQLEDDVRTLGIGVAVLTVVILLTLANSAYRWQQEQQRLTALRARTVDPLIAELDGAWDRGEIFLVYQPQIRLADGALVGVEALVRWRHPIRGLVAPDDFIPAAEKHGLIDPLGTWVFKAACEQAARWRNGALANIVISVNVSPLQLTREDCAERMIALQREADVPADRIVVEVTESTLIERGDRAIAALRALNDAGMLIAIDDFGTGYSSLSSLRLLPSRYLKIDRSFVAELPNSNAAAMIVRAVVGMGRGLGMAVIAEGVETSEQAGFLKTVGCEKAQGYFYGRPQSPDEIEAWAHPDRIRAIAG